MVSTTSLSSSEVTHPEHRTVRWCLALFIAFVLLQRLSVPGMTNVSILLPLALGWVGLALVREVIEVDPVRMAWWLAAAAATAMVTPLQLLFDAAPMISISSWGLLLIQFFPAGFRFVHRSGATFEACMAGVARICTWLASLSLVFMASQLVTPYQDLMAENLPPWLILEGFNTSYPVSFGSPIFKSNAWICLEASFLSYILAIGVLAALVSRQHVWRIVWLMLGLFSSASGSGFAILVAGVLVMILTGRGETLKRFIAPGIAVFAVAMTTPYGRQLLGRVTEVQDSRSSGSVRTIQPYIEMWPTWMSDPAALVFGRGAGSSQRLVSQTGIHGLLNPTLMKIFFDYGLLAGAVLFCFVWILYTRSINPTIAIAVGFSMWTLQTANVPFVVCILCTITLWSPPEPRHNGTTAADWRRRTLPRPGERAVATG